MSQLPTLAPRPPGDRPPVVERPSNKEHSEEEWEEKKDLIRRLYIQDNRKLSEIMATLEAKHGFAATEQMYKKRLKKWNIRKRAYRKNLCDSNQSSPGVGTDDDAIKVEDDVEEIPRRPSEPPTVMVHSPRSSYAELEMVLDSVFSWSQVKLESFGASSDPMSKYLAAPNQPPIQDSRTMYRTFELAFDLWNHGKGKMAGKAARKGFYVLEFVLTDDHPDLLWHVLDTMYDMLDRGHLQLLGMFLQHARVLAQQHLPPNHPLSRILKQLTHCDYQSDEGRRFVCHLLRQAWLRNVDMVGSRIGSRAPQHLWLYEQLIWDGRTRLRRESGLAERQGKMADALEELVHHHHHDDDHRHHVKQQQQQQQPAANAADDKAQHERLRVDALMLEFTQMDLGDRKKAETLAVDLINRTGCSDATAAADARSNARFHAYARKMLGRLHEERRDWDGAEENLRLAIAKREAAHGTASNLRVIRDMWVLAAYFERSGRADVATRIAQDAVSRAEMYLVDVPE